MGYCSKIYVIHKMDIPAGNGFKWAHAIAEFDICKFPPFQRLFDKDNCPATQYAPCVGDTDITRDAYGEPLRERSLEDVIECLEDAITADSDVAEYALVKPLLAMLQEFQKIQDGWYRLAVLHYGH
jgi:hypothetical protein